MAEVYRFEDFELDSGAYELRRAGRVVRLERIPLDLLFLLVERRGQLVTRQEIMERVWGKDVFVDSDTSVNTAVRKVRQALRENPDKPRLLFTVAGKGYRFATPPATAIPAAPIVTETATMAVPLPVVVRKSRRVPPWAAVAGVLVIAALVATPYLLRRFKPGPTKIMLVVLPFLNLSGDPSQEYLADGMTEEMITQLGSLDPGRLGVIARTSAMQYKGTSKNTAKIAHELGVDYLLEGSVRRAGQHVRVTTQMIQASDQTHIWAENFDRDLSDVLVLQSDAARSIASRIRLSLSARTEARLAGARPVTVAAYEAYLQGLQAFNQRTRDGMEQAIVDFQRAITLQPDYALAYSGLGRTFALTAVFAMANPADSMPKATEAVTHALSLDESLAEAHTTYAFVKTHFEYDWPGAEREYRRALELNHNDANAHFFYSNSYLSPFGRHDEAIAEMKAAVALDPLSMPIQSFAGRTYLWARRYDDALAQFQKANQLNPNLALNHERISHLFTYTGNFDGAIEEETKARLLSGEDPKQTLAKADAQRTALAARGPRGYWAKVLEFSEAKENPPEAYLGSYGRAIVYARLGEKTKALDCLEQAHMERQLATIEIGVEPAFDLLRSEPRFTALIRSIGLSH